MQERCLYNTSFSALTTFCHPLPSPPHSFRKMLAGRKCRIVIFSHAGTPAVNHGNMTRSAAVVQYSSPSPKTIRPLLEGLLHICVVEERWKLLCRIRYEIKWDVDSHPLSYFHRSSGRHHRPDSAICSYKAHQSSNQVSYSSF